MKDRKEKLGKEKLGKKNHEKEKFEGGKHKKDKEEQEIIGGQQKEFGGYKLNINVRKKIKKKKMIG